MALMKVPSQLGPDRLVLENSRQRSRGDVRPSGAERRMAAPEFVECRSYPDRARRGSPGGAGAPLDVFVQMTAPMLVDRLVRTHAVIEVVEERTQRRGSEATGGSMRACSEMTISAGGRCLRSRPRGPHLRRLRSRREVGRTRRSTGWRPASGRRTSRRRTAPPGDPRRHGLDQLLQLLRFRRAIRRFKASGFGRDLGRASAGRLSRDQDGLGPAVTSLISAALRTPVEDTAGRWRASAPTIWRPCRSRPSWSDLASIPAGDR